jgi:hypothetical protein
MNVLEWQATVTERAAHWLAHFVSTTPDDKLTWKPSADPSSKTRDILDMVSESIGANRMMAAMVRGETPKGDLHAAAPAMTSEQAQDELRASAKEFGDALRAADESILGVTYTTPFGPMPGYAIIAMPASNMDYHSGQVNYVQRLYGDIDFHMPPAQ